MDVQEKINSFKSTVERARESKARSEARIEQLEKQKKELLEQMQECNVNPETIDAEITETIDSINSFILRAEAIIGGFEGVI